MTSDERGRAVDRRGVHLALGRACEETVGEGRKWNESATHVDHFTDMSDGRLERDEEVVQAGRRVRL